MIFYSCSIELVINVRYSGLKLVADICSANLTGAQKGSCSIDFSPGSTKLPGHFSADPGTAGATTLLLQVSLPCLLFSTSPTPSTLTLLGGTNAIQAPQIEYTQHVFFPFLRQHFGLDLLLDIQKQGFYPKGGGVVFCTISPTTGPLRAVNLIERGAVTSIEGLAFVGNLPKKIADTMHEAATTKLVAAGISPDIINITCTLNKRDRAIGHGSGIILWAKTEGGCVLGGSAIGKSGLDPASVGDSAAAELLRNLEHGGCVDEYMQDQIILFLALAEGESVVKTGPLTLHTRYGCY
jgi:RNA 3'-terminal phosphate cyclase (ATP)